MPRTSVRTSAQAGGAAPETAEVCSVVRNADGTVTIYTPAPGVRAADLAGRLAAKGVGGVRFRSAASEVSAQAAAGS